MTATFLTKTCRKDTHHGSRRDTHHGSRRDTHHGTDGHTHHGTDGHTHPGTAGRHTYPGTAGRHTYPGTAGRLHTHLCTPWDIHPGIHHPVYTLLVYIPGYTSVHTLVYFRLPGATRCSDVAGRGCPGLNKEN